MYIAHNPSFIGNKTLHLYTLKTALIYSLLARSVRLTFRVLGYILRRSPPSAELKSGPVSLAAYQLTLKAFEELLPPPVCCLACCYLYISLLKRQSLACAFILFFLFYNMLNKCISDFLEHFSHQVINTNVSNVADEPSSFLLPCSATKYSVLRCIFLLSTL